MANHILTKKNIQIASKNDLWRNTFQKLVSRQMGLPLALESILNEVQQIDNFNELQNLSPSMILNQCQDAIDSLDKSYTQLSPAQQKMLLCLGPFKRFININYLNKYFNILQNKFGYFQQLSYESLLDGISNLINIGLLKPNEYQYTIELHPLLQNLYLSKDNYHLNSATYELAFQQYMTEMSVNIIQTNKIVARQNEAIALSLHELDNILEAIKLSLTNNSNLKELYTALLLSYSHLKKHHSIIKIGNYITSFEDSYKSNNWSDEIGLMFINILCNNAHSHREIKDFSAAKECLHRAANKHLNLNISTIHQQIFQAHINFSLGTIAEKTFDFEKAKLYYFKSLELQSSLPDSEKYLGGTHYHLAVAHEKTSEIGVALCHARCAFEFAKDSNDHKLQAIVLGKLSSILRQDNQLTLSKRYARQSINIYNQYGYHRDSAHSYHTLGLVLMQRNEFAPAELNFKKALGIRIDSKETYGEADTHYMLGKLSVLKNQMDEAENNFQISLNIYKAYQVEFEQADCYHELGHISLGRKDFPATLNNYSLALQLYFKHNNESQFSTVQQSLQNLSNQCELDEINSHISKLLKEYKIQN